MAHTYTSVFVHVVFSTKNRMKVLTDDIRERLYPFIGGIARTNGFRAIEVGGWFDHVHTLIAIPTTITIADAVKFMKGGSSQFVSTTFHRPFHWQEGYGNFSVSHSAVDATVHYIRTQNEHHRVKSFEEEYLEFLKENGIAYDEKYVFG